MQGNDFWTRACCYRKPPERAGNGSSLLLRFFIYLLWHVVGERSVRTCQCESCLPWGTRPSPPSDCLGEKRARVPLQQWVTRYNTCDCTASYLNKRVGCMGEAHARLGACVNMAKTKRGEKDREPRASELQLQQSDTLTHKCQTLKCRFFSLLLFPQMTPLWRT